MITYKNLNTWPIDEIKPIEFGNGMCIMKYYVGQEFMNADNREFAVTVGDDSDAQAIIFAGTAQIKTDGDCNDEPLLVLFKNGEMVSIIRMSSKIGGRVVLQIDAIKSVLNGKDFHLPTKEEVLKLKEKLPKGETKAAFNLETGDIRPVNKEEFDHFMN